MIITKGRSGLITKADLKRYKYSKARIRQLERMMRELPSGVNTPLVSVLTGMPGIRGYFQRQAATGAKCDELMRIYTDELNELIDLRLRIEKALEKLDPLERSLIRFRVFEALPWNYVCAQLTCSERNARRILEGAIDKIAS